MSYLQLCGDTKNVCNPPADVHNLFQGKVEGHTVMSVPPPPSDGLASQPLRLFFCGGRGASWSIIPRRLSFSLLQDSSHFAKHQVQKLQCRCSRPPLHIPLYIFDMFSLFSTRELCGRISACVMRSRIPEKSNIYFDHFIMKCQAGICLQCAVLMKLI